MSTQTDQNGTIELEPPRFVDGKKLLLAGLRERFKKVGKWLEQSDYRCVDAGADAPDFLERYGEEFDPQTGTGGIEVWVPIKV